MPADRRPSTSRRARQVNAVRRTAAPQPPEPRRGGGLTTRAAVLGLVVIALLVSAALPLREFLSQRGQIAEQREQQAAQQERVDVLKAQLEQLQDPAYVKAQARTRLHYVMPGETSYVLLTPAPAPVASGAPALPGTTATGPEAPWYSQVWGSVQAADRPAPAPTPTPAP